MRISGLARMLAMPLCVAALTMAIVMHPTTTLSSTDKVMVHPGQDIQSLVAASPAGTVFSIAPGLYQLQSIRPKDGDSFIGEPGAILSGAKALTDFTHMGQYWVANIAVNSQATYRGVCDKLHPACMFPQDLFVNDAPLERVDHLSEVGIGKWYLNYGKGKVYLGENPGSRKVEISLIAHAFYGSAKNVTIRGLTIEKCADVAGDGAIQGESMSGALSQGWVIQDNVIKLNHGMGIRLGNQMQVLNNKVISNGQMGLGGSGNGILVADNDIAYNNYAGYKYGWEAGGTKFTFTRGLVVRDNFVHNNNGPGLWTDIENHDTLYEHNRTTDNKEAGILHEISYHAVIRDNTIENDGFAFPGKTAPWYGGGIVITASQNVEVFDNSVSGCMNGIVGLQPDRKGRNGEPYLLRNLDVHNNVITQNTGIALGILASPVLGDRVFTSWNNRFSNNIFHLASENGKYFDWMSARRSLAQWRDSQKAH